MKILIHGLNYAPEPTGIGKFTGEMAEWLARRGHRVEVVTTPPYYPAWRIGEGYRGWRWRNETVNGVRIHRCPLYVPARPRGLSRLIHLASFAASSVPVAILRAIAMRPDVVIAIAPALVSVPGSRLAAWLGGAPAVLHIQDFEIDAAFALGIVSGGGLRGLALKLESCLLRCFQRVSSITPAMVARLADKGVAPGRTVLFPNWVDTKEIRPGESELRRALALPEDAIVAL